MNLLDIFLSDEKTTQREEISHILEFIEELENHKANGMGNSSMLLKVALTAISEAEHKIASLQEKITHLKELSTTDEDTNLLNKRGFNQQLRRVLANAVRSNQKGVFVLCDIDHFKRINDVYGHLAGDAVLREIATQLHTALRKTDVVGRIGGDEFALVMTNTDLPKAKKRLKQLQKTIQSTPVLWQGEQIPVSLSLGLTTYTSKSKEMALYNRADKRLYKAKNEYRKKGASSLKVIK